MLDYSTSRHIGPPLDDGDGLSKTIARMFHFQDIYVGQIECRLVNIAVHKELARLIARVDLENTSKNTFKGLEIARSSGDYHAPISSFQLPRWPLSYGLLHVLES